MVAQIEHDLGEIKMAEFGCWIVAYSRMSYRSWFWYSNILHGYWSNGKNQADRKYNTEKQQIQTWGNNIHEHVDLLWPIICCDFFSFFAKLLFALHYTLYNLYMCLCPYHVSTLKTCNILFFFCFLRVSYEMDDFLFFFPILSLFFASLTCCAQTKLSKNSI